MKVRGDSHDWCGRWLAKGPNPCLRASPFAYNVAPKFRKILEVPRSRRRVMGAGKSDVQRLRPGR